MAGAENKLKKSKGICMVAAELPPVLLLVLLPSHCRLLPLSPARWGTPCMESCHPGTVVPYWGSAGRGGHLVSVHANIAGAARCVPQHVSANGTEQGRARRWGQGEALRAPNNNNDRCRCWRFYHSKPLEWLSIGTLCLFREILTAVTFLNCHIPFNYDWHLMEMWARDWQPKQLSSFPQFFRFLPINRHNVGYFSGINSNLCPPPLFGKRSTLHSFQKAPWNAAEKGLSSSALLLLSSSSPPPAASSVAFRGGVAVFHLKTPIPDNGTVGGCGEPSGLGVGGHLCTGWGWTPPVPSSRGTWAAPRGGGGWGQGGRPIGHCGVCDIGHPLIPQCGACQTPPGESGTPPGGMNHPEDSGTPMESRTPTVTSTPTDSRTPKVTGTPMGARTPPGRTVTSCWCRARALSASGYRCCGHSCSSPCTPHTQRSSTSAFTPRGDPGGPHGCCTAGSWTPAPNTWT